MIEAAAAPPTPAARRWSLAAAIGSIAVFGVGIGFTTPLLALLLDQRGIGTALNGLNAAAAFFGVVLGPLLTPALARRFGIRRFLLMCMALDFALFLLMKPFDSFVAWLVLRAALGLFGSSIFTATEAWINLLADDKSRGRIIGVYTAVLYGGFASGPLLLQATGIAGWLPFLAVSSVTLVAMLPLLGAADAGFAGPADRPPAGPLAMFVRAPFLLLAAAFFGTVEQAGFSVLPLWGVRVGMPPDEAATLLTATSLGALVLLPLVGWLSDMMPRSRVMLLCAAAGLMGVLLLPVAAGTHGLYVLLFLWSGVTAGIYPVALGMAGARFSGEELVSINAALVICYGLGGLLGPLFAGAALALWSPNGFVAALALVLGLFLATTLAVGRAGQPRPKLRPHAVSPGRQERPPPR